MNDCTIIIPCKPYVKRFLTNQFGAPADLRKNRHFFNYFKLLLQKKICRHNKRLHFKQDRKMIYQDEIEVLIDSDTFNRFGFDLTATSVVNFNMFVEDFIKSQSRLFIFAANSFGQTWVNAIRDFQDAFGFSEDEFPTEAIKKDLQRHKDVMENFEKIFGTTVPDCGTSVPANL